ncbi:MAG: response regulator [Planctomycetes bacterium]|nr:response regulator [Planctomycetota bacterium]
MERRCILLVEDNPDDVELTLRALREHHMVNDIVVARDGAEALDYLFGQGAHAGRDTSELPAVVLLDLNLPKIGGLEVLKQVRATPLTKFLPVVILTSSKEDQDMVNSYELRCNSYVRKPVDLVEFTKAVKQLGIYWLLVNEPLPRRSWARPSG